MSASGLAGKKSVEGRKSAGAARLQKSNERSHRRAAYQPVRLSAVVAGGVFLSVLTLFASRWVALGGDWLGVFALRDTSPVEEVQLPIVEAAQVVSPPAVLDLSLAQSMDGSSQVWSLATHTQQDGRSLLIGGGKDGQIEIWDRESGQMLQTLPGHNDTVRTLAVAPSGEWLVSGSGDGLKVWQLETGLLMHSIPCGHGPIWSVSISPDGETFVSGDSDGNVSTWRLQDGRLLRNVNIGVPVWSVAVGPEGASFVSGSSDRTIRQWDLATGEMLRTFDGHEDAVRSVAISPDGRTLASGSWDKTIKLWDLASGELKKTLSGHEDRVVALAISPDGKSLASGSVDNTLKLWDLQTQTLTKTLEESISWILAVAFDSLEPTLVSAGKDQRLRVWQQSMR
ncbi:MAG: WD40 repeat domain-containing protein [Cyanobacteria bacterium J06623_5]